VTAQRECAVVLLTTTLANSPGFDLLPRLQTHLEDEVTRQGLLLHWYVLIQGATDKQHRSLPAFARCLYRGDVCGLSEARNQLLRAATSDGHIDGALVGFPDDDAWHPSGLLSALAEEFAAQPSLDLWFCGYASQPQEARGIRGHSPTTRELVRNASSNTLFVRGAVVQSVGSFDEQLGVGTPLGGSEDLDYALRCMAVSRTISFVDRPLIGHRDKTSSKRADYYLSSAFVLRRHCALPGVRREYIRKLAVGVALVARQDMPARRLWKVLRRRVTDDGSSRVTQIMSDGDRGVEA
jgi:hypothetical protein